MSSVDKSQLNKKAGVSGHKNLQTNLSAFGIVSVLQMSQSYFHKNVEKFTSANEMKKAGMTPDLRSKNRSTTEG